ncbi:MAG: hypothetical protein ACR2NS_12970 [Gemmatimonadaceae bacterium]
MMWVGDLLELLATMADGLFTMRDKKLHPFEDETTDMPLVRIEDLPDSSRAWVFGSDRALDAWAEDLLFREVDRFLSQWHAHGAPLTVGRDWKYRRFLTVAVDQSTAGASGCSIDGLFRALKSLESRLGASLVNSGLVYFRDAKGEIQAVDRDRFAALGAEGKIKPDTRVFDPTVATLGEWRARFELAAANSWHAGLLPAKQPA